LHSFWIISNCLEVLLAFYYLKSVSFLFFHLKISRFCSLNDYVLYEDLGHTYLLNYVNLYWSIVINPNSHTKFGIFDFVFVPDNNFNGIPISVVSAVLYNENSNSSFALLLIAFQFFESHSINQNSIIAIMLVFGKTIFIKPWRNCIRTIKNLKQIDHIHFVPI
jgi:hypothetical protein